MSELWSPKKASCDENSTLTLWLFNIAIDIEDFPFLDDKHYDLPFLKMVPIGP